MALEVSRICKVPAHRLSNPGIERLRGVPAELRFEEAAVDRVAEVVTQPVSNGCEKLVVRSLHPRGHLVENAADLPCDVDVAALAPPSGQIGLARAPAAQHCVDRFAVILHI